MDIRISPVKSPSFGVKYLHSDDLQDIVQYSIEHGKFDKLNKSRKNVDKYKLTTRLLVNIYSTDGYPTIKFTRYEPSKDVPVALSMADYEKTKEVEYISSKPSNNILKFALEKLIRIGNDAPKNKIFQKVVLSPRD